VVTAPNSDEYARPKGGMTDCVVSFVRLSARRSSNNVEDNPFVLTSIVPTPSTKMKCTNARANTSTNREVPLRYASR
jgi:hypothetical protein